VKLLVDAERAILFALNFDLLVDIPNAWVLPAVRALGLVVPQGREPRGALEAATREVVTSVYSLLGQW